jgi:hypothetical protein
VNTRRLLAIHAIALGFLASSAACNALYAVTLAADNASDPAYADGWQGLTTNNDTGAVETLGDNGGFGFEPWNFDTDWLFNPDPPDGLHDIDAASPYNQLGAAWRMSKPEPDQLPRAGRGFAPLQIGHTLSVVFDNPIEFAFNTGYFIRFNSRNGVATGGGNICYDFEDYSTACTACDPDGDGYHTPIGADPVPKLEVRQYQWVDSENWGRWAVLNNADADPEDEHHYLDLTNEQTAAQGARLDLTITGPDQYELRIDPLGPGATHVETGTMLSAGMPVDWIEFTFFNTLSDPGFPTDFYIRSLEITGPAPAATGDFDNDGDADGADLLAWQRGVGMTTGATRAQGDANADGDVDAADLTVWKSDFGASAVAAHAIPEPAPLLLAAIALSCAPIPAPRPRSH